jgi:hypothetical protein
MRGLANWPCVQARYSSARRRVARRARGQLRSCLGFDVRRPGYAEPPRHAHIHSGDGNASVRQTVERATRGWRGQTARACGRSVASAQRLFHSI